MLAERIRAAAKPQAGPGCHRLVPELFGDRDDILSKPNTRPRVVDEDEDMGDVQPCQAEAPMIAERFGKRLRLAEVTEQ